MTKALWPHQVRAEELLLNEYKKGHKWVVVVKPTGAGKTHFASSIASKTVSKHPEDRCLWVVHRTELVEQAYDSLTEWGLSCGVIQSSPTRPVNPHRPVQVASIQTLLARNIRPENIRLVIPDEAHHSVSSQWLTVFEHYKRTGAYGLGLTATPLRGDNLPLDIFDSLVCPVTTRELIRDGFLVPFELQRPRKPLRKGQIAQRPVDAYLKFAAGRKTIVFAPGKKAAADFVDQFIAAGVRTAMVHGLMPLGERRDILARYGRGEFEVVVNVGVLTEGFDDRPTSCVIIARKVGSISLLRQMCGRALRSSPETGKVSAILLDLHGSTHEPGGVPDVEPEWSLEGDGVRKKVLERGPERFCAACGVLLEDLESTICPDCGVERPGQAPPEVVNAELVRYAWKRKETPQERGATLRRWVEEGQRMGYKPGWAFAKYTAVYGSAATPEVVALSNRSVTDIIDTATGACY